MNGKQIVELKKKYDAVAYIPFENEQIGNRKIYFRSPTVSEYVKYTVNPASDIKFQCIQDCVFGITDDAGTEITDIDGTLQFIDKHAGAFLVQLFDNILALSPLASKEKTTEIYLAAKENQKLLLNTFKLDLLVTFQDYKLAEASDKFSFKKFIEYLVMLEEAKGNQGIFMSQIVDDETLLEPHVKEALDKVKKGKKQKRPNFPKDIRNADPRTQDPAIRSALESAQNALNAQMAKDKAGIKTSIDFEAENAEHDTNFNGR